MQAIESGALACGMPESRISFLPMMVNNQDSASHTKAVSSHPLSTGVLRRRRSYGASATCADGSTFSGGNA